MSAVAPTDEQAATTAKDRGSVPGLRTDEMMAKEISRIYSDVKLTAQEFNQRGDLFAGANIAGFDKVANAMLAYGAI